MKLSVLQEDLAEKLNIALRFVSGKPQLPVLANILLKTDNGKLKISATNLEMGIVISLGAKVEKNGEITIPARILTELVSTLSTGRISLEEQKGQLFISRENFLASISGIPATEFPKVPDKIQEVSFTILRQTIMDIAKQVSFAASTDETRPVLTGILLQIKDGLVSVATDGFRLSYKKIETKKPNKGVFELLIPAKVFAELSKAISEKEDDVEVAFLEKEGQLIFDCDSFILTTRFLEGEFPAWEKVVPTTWTTRVVTDKTGLTQAIRATSVFAKESTNVVKVKIGEGKMVFSSESSQYGKEEVGIDAKTEGDGLEIAYNYKYILEFLGSIDGDTISIETNSPTAPSVFQDTKDKNFKHIIMPIKIQT